MGRRADGHKLLNEPLEHLNERFDRQEARLDRVETKVDGLTADMKGVKSRLTKVEHHVGLNGTPPRLQDGPIAMRLER